MSWQAASLGLIALVLIGGGVWYERSRPSARLVALVAALAALAIAGRLALAPLPNVVATTDVALLAGYSLGAAPGFAVGALAGFVSNIWLGQGPWTPWQMAGWGLVGLGGAGLARLTLWRAGRSALALAAGIAGLAYGALLDLSVMVNFGGEQSIDRYLALSARGIPFNAAHAIGNVLIIWAAGPAIVRMLMRYRSRASFIWHDAAETGPAKSLGAAGVSALALLAASAMLLPAMAFARPADQATGWLRAQQNGDGGWGSSPDARSSPGMTAWVMLGLEAGGVNPIDVRRGRAHPVTYLRKRVGAIRSATDLERTILALEGAGVDARRFAGRDLVAGLLGMRRADGSWKGGVNPTSFGVLALEAAGASGQATRSLRWLRRAQNEDGGWGFDRGVGSDPDSTGAALQALATKRAGSRGELRGGARFLRRVQRGDGGFPAQPGLLSNSQSTAWAIQGLIAAGVDPGGVRKRRSSPLDYLRGRQAGDGHVSYSKASDQTPVWVTAQAAAALARQALPIAAVARGQRAEGVESGSGEGAQERGAVASDGPSGPAAGSGSGSAVSRTRGAGLGGKRGRKGGKSGRKDDGSRGAKDESDAQGPRAGRVVVKADPGSADIEPAELIVDTAGDWSPGAGLIALALAGLGAALGAGFWLYRRRSA